MTYTWNPADKAAEIILSNGDLTATHDGSGGSYDYRVVRATDPLPSGGKHYWEVIMDAPGRWAGCGLMQGSSSLTTYIGDTSGDYGADTSGYLYPGGQNLSSFSAGDRFCWAVDVDAGKLWVRRNNDPWAWQNGNGDPASGTHPYWTGAMAGLYPGFYAPNGEQGTAAFSADSFAYPVPSGFSAYAPEPPTGTLYRVGGYPAASNAWSTLVSGASAGATSFSVAAGEGARFPEIAYPYFMTVTLAKAGRPRLSPADATEVTVQSHAAGSDHFTCEEVPGTTDFGAGDLVLAAPSDTLFSSLARKRATEVVTSATYQVTSADEVVVVDTDAVGSDATVTYPASPAADKIVTVMNAGSSDYGVTLDGNGKTLYLSPSPLTDGESMDYQFVEDLDQWMPLP